MCSAFPSDSEFSVEKFTSSFISNGLVQRIRGMLEARKHQGDINHITGDVHYLVFGLPGKRTVLTIHDCGFMSHPNLLARQILKLLWLDLPVRHCKYVTAVSEATKKDIVRYTGCDESKVIVIPTVVATAYHSVPKEFNAGCPRILHIGLAPNKNFERHVAAISGIDCHLHIVGKLRDQHIGMLEKYGVTYTSEYSISKEAMIKAYIDADIVLFASTREGFGMPIVEGQSIGRPVITSSVSSMPEVAGGGACLVDPFSVESIRDGVMRVIEDPDYRVSLQDRGYENVKRFSPGTVARQYEALYRMVAE